MLSHAGALVLVPVLAAAAGPAAAPLPGAPALRALVTAAGGAEVVVFDEPRPGQAPHVLAAALSRAPVTRFRSLLGDVAAYQRAIPSLRRAEVRREEAGARLVSWEVEVPLWNLAGQLWMRPRGDAVVLDITEGDLAPGRARLEAQAGEEGTLLLVDFRANVREANFATRRLAARSPLAEPAMAATTAYVVLRALVLEAERAGAAPDPKRRPTAAPGAPPLDRLEGTALAKAAAAHAPALVTAAVRSRPDGRLAWVEVAVPSRVGPEAARRQLAEPQRWRALPGWRQIDVTAAGWKVDTRFPFVDFDATWAVSPGPPLRAQATAGDTRGAVLGWDVAAPGPTLAVFSFYPRIERTGYVARRFVEAEPLLEQGLSLGLAYVNAVALVRALTAAPGQGAQ